MSSKSVAAIKRHRTARLAKLITRSYYLHRKKQQAQMYTAICDEFVSLGGVYVKFLQGVMLRSAVLRRWHNPDRLKIFENLESEPLDIVNILQHELGAEKLKQITGVQPQPFAAGSFGQVYFGQHINGRPIIVKVLRPMVRELLRHDLRLLTMFSKRFYGQMFPNMQLNINSAVRDFVQATLRETDYVTEANFANELYQHYKGSQTYIIPETFLELCTPNIIVQEYVDGISVAQVIRLQEQGVDPKEYVAEQLGSDLDIQLENLGFESINGIFTLERIQGDPHPGNIRLMTNNRVGLIDFGISANTPRNKAAFFGLIDEWSRMYSDNKSIVNIFEQFMRFFVSDLYRALKKLSTFRKEQADDSNFTREVGQVAQETFTSVMGSQNLTALLQDGRILQIINQVVNKDNRFGLVMKLEASEMLRAAQTYITLVETLGRRGVVLPKVFERVVKQVEQDFPGLRHEHDESMSIADALEIVSNWLERVAERDPALFQQLMTRIKLGTSPTKVMDIKEPTNA